MNNPYINNANTGAVGEFDDKINGYLKDLPLVPRNFNTSGFLRGVLIGAGVAYLLSNEKAQQSLFKAIVKAGNLLQGGMEELKERFEDAKAEIDANN